MISLSILSMTEFYAGNCPRSSVNSPPNAVSMAEYFERARHEDSMHDSIEADLLAARHLGFGGDEPAWTDRYVTSLSRLDPSLTPADAALAARRAWRSHSWAHPAVVAYLEHESGALDAG